MHKVALEVKDKMSKIIGPLDTSLQIVVFSR